MILFANSSDEIYKFYGEVLTGPDLQIVKAHPHVHNKTVQRMHPYIIRASIRTSLKDE